MRYLLAVLAMSCSAANAQYIYKCPQTYPGKDTPATPLTGAYMHRGEMRGDGWISPPPHEAAAEGYDARYPFMDDEQAWLVCTYGSRKRIKGRVHDGHEWGQRMEAGDTEWWMKLAPKVGVCMVQVREVKARSQSTWTVAADCNPPSTR